MALVLGNNDNNGYMDHGDITALNGATALTVACWSLAGVAVSPGSIDKATSSGLLTTLTFFQAGGDGSAYAVGDGNVFTTHLWWLRTANGVIDTTKWTHMAVVYDGTADVTSRVTVYKDLVSFPLWGINYPDPGTPAQGEDADTTAPTSLPTTTSDPLKVNEGNVSGVKAHLRLWLAALTPAELALERERYWAGRRENLLMDCPYDDQIAGRDYSGNGNHGTAVTGPPIQRHGPPVSYGGKVLVTG